MPTNEQIQALLDEYVTGNISPADKELLLTWLNDPAIARQVEELLQHELISGRYEADRHPGVHSRLHTRLQAVMDASIQAEVTAPPSSLLSRMISGKKWWAAAAILIVLLGAGMYWLLQPNEPVKVETMAATDVPPGSNKARLTLANGSVVMLDSTGNQVIQQGNSILKQQDGQLVYDAKALTTDNAPLTFNTLATPRGGQYQLVLPDGTRVWLNAASSIRYPTAFAGNERVVYITGEAYFEVTKNAHMPFRVQANDRAEVEVLGTHFNINAYADEDAIRTTLLEGKVKVTANPGKSGQVVKDETASMGDGSQQLAARSSKLLSPGQQARLSNNQLSVINDPDIDQVMAWKNGAFSFDDKSLKEVMRLLARWYDIEVVFEGEVPSVTFVGEMGRDVHLSKVLTFLKGSRVHCRMEGNKKLIISN